MKFQLRKTYYQMDVYEFNLPAGHTCPYAKECKINVDRTTGKFERVGTGFRCYAAGSERFPSVRESRWRNYEFVKTAGVINLPIKAKYVRIHGSGDFFSQQYFDLWLKTCKDNPTVKFWAFTKSIQYWLNRLDEIPKNLILTASYGGLQDYLIDENSLKYAKVFKTRKLALKSDLPIDTDDTLAMELNTCFALIDNYAVKEKN